MNILMMMLIKIGGSEWDLPLSKADPQMMRKAVATAAGRIEETDGERY